MADRAPPSVETRDLPPRVFWILWLGFGVFIGGSILGLLLFFDLGQPWTFHRLLKPAPVLQISPPSDYAAFIADKRAELAGYGWQDSEAGLARIPIEEAMRLVSEGHRAEMEAPGQDCSGTACAAAAKARERAMQ